MHINEEKCFWCTDNSQIEDAAQQRRVTSRWMELLQQLLWIAPQAGHVGPSEFDVRQNLLCRHDQREGAKNKKGSSSS